MNWFVDLDEGSISNAVRIVTTSNPTGIKIMKDRSENPFDYNDFVSSMLKFIGNIGTNRCDRAETITNKREKNNDESRKLREEGNKVFLSKSTLRNFEDSLGLYTQSIAYAVANSQEMAKGFANRSALLFKLNLPKECLEDIDSALNSNYPDELKPKLFLRQAECYSILVKQSYMESKFWLNKVPANDPNLKMWRKELKNFSGMDYQSTVDEEPVLPEIKSPHAKFPCASDAIDVEYSAGYMGKRIVATRNIKTGEVLVVEKPYSTHFSTYVDYYHCARCLEAFWNGIPCDNCVNVVYCSHKCKESAWEEYHDLECSALNSLIEANDGWKHFFPCLKLLIKFKREAGGLRQLRQRIQEFQNQGGRDRELQREWYYEKQTLESILTLQSNVNKLSNEYFKDIIVVGIQALLSLVKNTDFFGPQYRAADKHTLLMMSQDPDVLFVGGLLLHLILILVYHSELPREKGFHEIVNKYRGMTQLPFTQLFGISCYSNTTPQFIGENVVVRTLAPIAKGEEVYMYFGNTWAMMPSVEERHAELFGMRRECTWKNCNKWPTMDHLETCLKRAKSMEMKNKLQKAMKQLQSLKAVVDSQDIRDKEGHVLDGLNKIMDTICEAANLPCYEQALVVNTIILYYFHIGKTSKIQSISHKFKKL